MDEPAATTTPARETPDRRATILANARELFLHRGYAAISMQQIADATGINKATLYHHFRDKDDLFLAVLAREIDETRCRIESAIAAEGSTRDRLERVVRLSLDQPGCDMPSLFTALKHEVEPARRDAFLADQPVPWRALAPMFRAAMGRGELRPADPDAMVELFFAMVRSQAPGPWRHSPARPDDEVVDLVVGTLLDGLVPRAAAGVAADA